MPRTPRRATAGLLAAIVATAGCTLPMFAPDRDPGSAGDPPSASQGAPAVAGMPAAWRRCPEVPQRLVGRSAEGMTYECASVAVPRDWNAPTSGSTYEVALIRVRSSAQTRRIGSLVLNPGGPGASGIDTAVYLSFGEKSGGLPKAVTDRFDIVGFDPRGVGQSSPVKCISDADQDAAFAADPDPVDQAAFDEVSALWRRVAAACGAAYGTQLPLFSTEQAARDLDAIRAAVGDEKLTYLGYSYGTLLGATYAQLFPTKVRALALDGAIDPQQSLVEGAQSQAKGFERAFGNFTRWCSATAAKCPIAPDARKAVTDAIEEADRSPITSLDGRRATDGWVFLAVIASLYTESGWEKLAKAVDDLRGGDPEDVLELADSYADRDDGGEYSNLFDANNAVNCADSDAAPTVAQVRRLQAEWRTKYPLFGGALAVGMLSCTYWPGKRDPYPAGPAAGAPPILVVGTTGDPATPYENTARLARMLTVGRVLTWQGEGHTAYPNTPCIVAAVDAYLIDLTVPREESRCPAK